MIKCLGDTGGEKDRERSPSSLAGRDVLLLVLVLAAGALARGLKRRLG